MTLLAELDALLSDIFLGSVPNKRIEHLHARIEALEAAAQELKLKAGLYVHQLECVAEDEANNRSISDSPESDDYYAADNALVKALEEPE